MIFISLHKTNSAVSPDLSESGGVHVEANCWFNFPTRRDEQSSREQRIRSTNTNTNILCGTLTQRHGLLAQG